MRNNKRAPGVIQVLQKIHNLDDFLEVESSDPFDDSRKAKNSFDYKHTDLRFETKPYDITYFKFSFKSISLCINAYRIKSSENGFNASHLRSWSFYGSNDDKEWTLIDRKEDESVLNGYLFNEMFVLNKVVGPFSMFMINETLSWLYLKKIMFAEFDVYDQSVIAAYRYGCKTLLFKRRNMYFQALIIIIFILCS